VNSKALAGLVAATEARRSLLFTINSLNPPMVVGSAAHLVHSTVRFILPPMEVR
jgi:hypothetical protein